MTMDYDATKLDEVVLALLHFNSQTDHGVTRRGRGSTGTRWIGCTRRAFISNPKSKAKSVVLTEEGLRRGGVIQEALWQGRITAAQAPAFAGHGPAIADAAAVERQIR